MNFEDKLKENSDTIDYFYTEYEYRKQGKKVILLSDAIEIQKEIQKEALRKQREICAKEATTRLELILNKSDLLWELINDGVKNAPEPEDL